MLFISLIFCACLVTTNRLALFSTSMIWFGFGLDSEALVKLKLKHGFIYQLYCYINMLLLKIMNCRVTHIAVFPKIVLYNTYRTTAKVSVLPKRLSIRHCYYQNSDINNNIILFKLCHVIQNYKIRYIKTIFCPKISILCSAKLTKTVSCKM